MKILLINGSSRPNRCPYTALREIADTLESGGAETEILFLGSGPVRDCIGCNQCVSHCPQSIKIPQQLRRIDRFVEQLKQGTL